MGFNGATNGGLTGTNPGDLDDAIAGISPCPSEILLDYPLCRAPSGQTFVLPAMQRSLQSLEPRDVEALADDTRAVMHEAYDRLCGEGSSDFLGMSVEIPASGAVVLSASDGSILRPTQTNQGHPLGVFEFELAGNAHRTARAALFAALGYLGYRVINPNDREVTRAF